MKIVCHDELEKGPRDLRTLCAQNYYSGVSTLHITWWLQICTLLWWN